MNKKLQEVLERRYSAACMARGLFATKRQTRDALISELAARRDVLRRRLAEAQETATALASDLASIELDLDELENS